MVLAGFHGRYSEGGIWTVVAVYLAGCIWSPLESASLFCPLQSVFDEHSFILLLSTTEPHGCNNPMDVVASTNFLTSVTNHAHFGQADRQIIVVIHQRTENI